MKIRLLTDIPIRHSLQIGKAHGMMKNRIFEVLEPGQATVTVLSNKAFPVMLLKDEYEVLDGPED